MARNNKNPLTFLLPDGEKVSLVTWEYVVDKLTNELGDIIDTTEKINDNLSEIDEILDNWINK